MTESTLKSGANRFHNQVQWARQYLVWQGLIDDSKRGTWALTPLGWKTHLDEPASREVFLSRARHFHPRASESLEAATAPAAELLPPDEQQEQSLLELLRSLPPSGFELLGERLLREHGFEMWKSRKSRVMAASTVMASCA